MGVAGKIDVSGNDSEMVVCETEEFLVVYKSMNEDKAFLHSRMR